MRVNAFIKAFALGVVGIALLAFPLMSAQEHPTAASKVEVSKKDTVDGKTGKNWTLYNGDYLGKDTAA